MAKVSWVGCSSDGLSGWVVPRISLGSIGYKFQGFEPGFGLFISIITHPLKKGPCSQGPRNGVANGDDFQGVVLWWESFPLDK